MARTAVIENGVVINVVMADEGWDSRPVHGPGTTAVHLTGLTEHSVNIGWTYDGTTFAPPSPPPVSIPELIQILNDHQIAVEERGFTVGGVAVRLPSTERAKTAYIAGQQQVDGGRKTATRAKGINGEPIWLTPAQVTAAYNASVARFEACMNVYHKLHPMIVSGQIKTFDQIQNDPDWPA